MKISFIFSTIILCLTGQTSLFGQWTAPSGGITSTNPLTLSVGIGTASPTSRLHVVGGRITVESSSEASTQYKVPSLSQSWDVGANSLGYYIFESSSASYKFVINKNGNIGIGTNSPSNWFSGRVLEMYDSRPVFKFRSSSATNMNTVVFTNDAVNSSTHNGEFHVNHNYNPTSADRSQLRFSSYPALDVLVLESNGNVGVGLSNPSVKFEVAGPTVRFSNPATTTDAYTSFRLGGPNYPYGLEIDFFGNNNITSNLDWSYNGGPGSAAIINFNPKPLVLGTNNLCRLMIKGDGNVLIGKTSQLNETYKLDVNGSVRANEITVNTSGADFVFSSEYRLRPLAEVADYIKENKHLPEIEPANCMAENGVDVGMLQTKLLQKVEELTLYIIQQQVEIESLKKEIANNKRKRR